MDPILLAPMISNELANEAAREALKSATAPLSRLAGSLGKSVVDQLVVQLQLGFHDYMRTSYEKCRHFKSVLPPSQPRDILAHYQQAEISNGRATFPASVVFENPYHTKSSIITGLAGSGKSMLLKYFVASYFVHPRGPIPLFVELRRLNKFTSRNILSFIRSDCVSAANQVSEEQFGLALRGGVFTLVLDGFDEVNHEFKDDVQAQILEIRRLYPDLSIIISSRPDPRFRGWPSFEVYHVNELDQKRCLDLIDSFEYDKGLKKRFAAQVKSGLWNSHSSFLQYPLLVSIMLLTYEEFAEIPRRQHVFYRLAFDTLFSKHDADKEQYQRSVKTGMQLEEFRNSFSAFCGLSYIKQHVSFDDEKLNHYCELASKYAYNAGDIKKPFDAAAFISDLFDAVCILHKDGLETTFVHRSFQEYFSAYFATRLPADKMAKVLDSYAHRLFDEVLEMAFEMSREVVEASWTLPTIDGLLAVFADDKRSAKEKFWYIINVIGVKKDKDGVSIASFGHNDPFALLQAIGTLYDADVTASDIFAMPRRFGDVEKMAMMSDGTSEYTLAGAYNYDTPSDRTGSEDLVPDDGLWFEAVGAEKWIAHVTSVLVKLRRQISSRDRKGDEIIAELI